MKVSLPTLRLGKTLKSRIFNNKTLIFFDFRTNILQFFYIKALPYTKLYYLLILRFKG
jgi:hypothetical protein